MARRPNYGAEKREKERKRQQKREAKDERRQQRREGPAVEPGQGEDAGIPPAPAGQGD